MENNERTFDYVTLVCGIGNNEGINILDSGSLNPGYKFVSADKFYYDIKRKSDSLWCVSKNSNEKEQTKNGGLGFMEQLKRELRERYISTYNECKKFKYLPRAFLDMVVSNDDIVDVTKRLIHKEGGTSGFIALFENDRMDLSIEKIILESRFRELFTFEDLDAAYIRLNEYKYKKINEIEKP